ncbi:hypothetical protein Tco_0775580 [Tanacetum coccineum]
MDENQLNEVVLVVAAFMDAENLLVDSEIQVMDDVIVDPDVKDNFVAALVAMFWADKVAKFNYKEFGDIISFDATFGTNKIDNHRKCMTVKSGSLLKEDKEAYTWLLRSFMTAHQK